MSNDFTTEAELNIDFTAARVSARGWEHEPEEMDRFVALRLDARFRDAQIAALYEHYFLPARHEFEWQALSGIVYAVIHSHGSEVAALAGMASGVTCNAAYDTLKHLCLHTAKTLSKQLGPKAAERVDSFRAIAQDTETLKAFFEQHDKARIDEIERVTKIPRERIFPIIKLAGLNHFRRENACYWQMPTVHSNPDQAVNMQDSTVPADRDPTLISSSVQLSAQPAAPAEQ